MIFFPNKQLRLHFTPAEKIGFAALTLAFLLSFTAPRLALSTLIIFILLNLAAPFFPQTGFFLPVISHNRNKHNAIALSFDDGPCPGSTPVLLDLLDRYAIKATFFVIGSQAERYPELIRDILDRGHTIGNHSWNHDILLMFRTPKTLENDINSTQLALKQHGILPLTFRPPVGITGPRLGRILDRLGMFTVNFSCRAHDRGNRTIEGMAERILGLVRGGDILLLHDSPPYQSSEEYWQKELTHLFGQLLSCYRIIPLAQLIDRAVMEKLPAEHHQSTQ